MPELPEVETVARSLRPALVGRTVVAVELSGKPLRMLKPVDRKGLQQLVGARFVAVRRRAKYLLLDLSNGDTILVHLGMTGQLGVARGPRQDHTHVVLQLDDGAELRFRDPRRFGWLAPYATDRVGDSAELRVLGPDPLEPGFTPHRLAETLRATRGCDVKAFLLDQRRVAGVGNIYASEALFIAGIRPTRKANRLSARAAQLHAAIIQVLSSAIERRGTTFRDFLDAEGWAGENQHALQVFMKAGQPCPRCGGRIRRVVQNARSTFYCPKCQR